MRRHTFATLVTVAALVVAGCTGGDRATPSERTVAPDTPPATGTVAPTSPATTAPATTAPTTASPAPASPAETDDPTPPPTDEATTASDEGAPFFATTEVDTGQSSGDPVTVVDVRVGRHDGFDRVVFETDGGGVPGWEVGYVDEAIAQGSGQALDVAGDVLLRVVLTNVAYPTDTGVDEFPDDRVDGGRVVTEVVFDTVFEGQAQAFVGLDQELPFRAFAYDDGRVLVEILHEPG